ncbi:hypothetical protein SAMN05660477_01697 [Soonwooa buanensis]|uniref:Uncharacterized protein n=1 Tax=Soonwooa buanensis TaxID=619805 RepID=A0A1T5F1B8_9FLAO|nr:hypothetical protein [Soonwooa buanensis]SKB89965.1 hypothetical protein SAMN05660477_01697 [Soonwooa buanensis]
MKKLVFVLASLALVACKEAKKEESVESASSSEVTKSEEKAPDDTATPKVEAPISLSTKSLGGEVISVIKAKVIGKVLYVELTTKAENADAGNTSLHVIDIGEINYVDDAEAKKHDVLKDDEGVYQASPLQTSGSSRLQFSTKYKAREVLVSLKFAAPPETSKTITLNIPDFGSFDSIPITR